MFYIGADLGTSSLKLLLADEEGIIHRTVTESYPLELLNHGWSQQNPDDWWEKTVTGLQKLCEGIDPSEIGGIGVAGQMHGLVILDENDQVIRPCILWNDARTAEETEYLNTVIGRETLSACTANIAYAGFTAPKLLWLQKNEPENFGRIRRIMLPKDYINYRLSGVHSCDYSDASGTLLLDVKNKCWSEQMCEICSVKKEWLPQLYESYETIGTVSNDELPFLKGVKVAAGAGDNAAAAVGTNTVSDMSCNISLGTSGTIFIAADHFAVDDANSLHSFAHASGKYHLMGCILSAASCRKWFLEDVLKRSDYGTIEAEITDDMLGNNHIYFLPYLMGERSPLNDTDARACFIGMDLSSSPSQMELAVMEGVAFAIRDCLEAASAEGIRITASTLCGGGARSELWQKIMANVLNIRIDLPEAEEGPGYGGALLAMMADGRFETMEECSSRFFRIRKSVEPDHDAAMRYEQRYQIFRRIYPALKDIFKQNKEEKK